MFVPICGKSNHSGENMSKFQQSSYRYYWFFQICFYLIPIVTFLFWLSFSKGSAGSGQPSLFMQLGIGNDLMQYIHGDTVPLGTKLFAFLISMIPGGIIMYGLSQLIMVFKNYSQGNVFVYHNVLAYKKLVYTLFAWVIGGLIYDALISVVLSFANPPRQRMLTLSLSGIDLVSLITGAVVILIAKVMQQAQKLEEESYLTI